MLGTLGAAGLAAGVGVQLLNNAMADEKAREAFGRQRILMNDQNRNNVANVQSQAGREVQGYRAAGLNPALMLAGGTQAAPTVSQGNADMAQTFPLQINDMLALAQLENIQAQTENVKATTAKTNAEVPNVNADTDLKMAQKLYQDASTEVQKEKAQEIANINKTYADQNSFLEDQGPAMMQAYREKLKANGVWDKMLPKTRDTIDAMADNDLPMSIGALKALNDIMDSEGKMTDTDTKMVKNALTNAVIHEQLSDKSVINAMAKMPWYDAELKKYGIDKIKADINKVAAEITKIAAEIPKINSEAEYQQLINTAYKSGNLDYLKSQGEYGKWLEKYCENLLQDIIPVIANKGNGGVKTINTSPTKTIINVGNNNKPNPTNNNNKPNPTYNRGSNNKNWNGSWNFNKKK